MGKENAGIRDKLLRDPDEIHQKLQARRRLIKERDRKVKAQIKRKYFKMQENEKAKEESAKLEDGEMTFEEKRRLQMMEDIK